SSTALTAPNERERCSVRMIGSAIPRPPLSHLLLNHALDCVGHSPELRGWRFPQRSEHPQVRAGGVSHCPFAPGGAHSSSSCPNCVTPDEVRGPALERGEETNHRVIRSLLPFPQSVRSLVGKRFGRRPLPPRPRAPLVGPGRRPDPVRQPAAGGVALAIIARL